jgi:hypothetical protein
LNERELAFRDYYIESGDYCQAYMLAGYSPNPANAYKKMLEIHRHITEAVRVKIGSHAPWALRQLVLLATNAKSETVKLNALRDILNRAGFTGDSEPIGDDPQAPATLAREDLQEEVKGLLKQASKSFED